MKRPSLLKTSAVRMALGYIAFYAVILVLVLTALTWWSTRRVDADLAADLRQEFKQLVTAIADDDAGSGNQARRILDTGYEAEHRVYLLLAADGSKIAGNLNGWPGESDIPLDGKVHMRWVDEQVIPLQIHDDDALWPVAAHEFDDGRRLLVGRQVEQAALLLEAGEYLLAVLSAALVLALLLAVTLGRGILRRVDTIGRTANDIMRGDLSRRIPVSESDDEFDTLARRLNHMLDRIQQLLNGVREVTDNVAHDLRSPLTRLRNQLDVTLLEPRSEPEYREAIKRAIEEVEGLITTLNAVLQTAQADAGTLRAELQTVGLSHLIEELGELYQPVAEQHRLRLLIEAGSGIGIRGNRDLLAQAIGNLLDNAVKFSPPGGQIDLKLVLTAEGVDILVADSGPGIPASERQRVRQRFVRLDGARGTEGNGLGLSLVDAIARQQEATLHFEDNQPGLRAVIRFSRRLMPSG